MVVDLIDLKSRYQDEHIELARIIDKVLQSGNLILSDGVKKFEEQICSYVGANYCLGVNSGTDALMLALWACGVVRGDEVITTPISFIASAGAIVHLGAKPVFVDVGSDLNIDPKEIEGAITKKTSAIMPVHWGGRVCQMDEIQAVARKFSIPIIEDCAQGMGSYYKGKHSGSFGDIAAFSAHPLKNLGAIGDGGFVVTNNKDYFDKIKLYRNHGLESRDHVVTFGVNSRLDSVNAEILTHRLLNLRNFIEKRNRNVQLYKKYITTNQVQFLNVDATLTHSYVMFIVLCEERDELQTFLTKNQIQSLVYYGTPLHLQPASSSLGYKEGDFPVAESMSKKVLALPHHQYLTKEQIKFVCSKINEFYKSR